jgi:hypothetical protein
MSGRGVDLPDDLEKVLKVLADGILQGHIKLAAALRRRYESQYPLVRSLADVFISYVGYRAHHMDTADEYQSYILREYNTYVLHLERALAQVDEALSVAAQAAAGSKRVSRRIEDTEQGRLGKILQVSRVRRNRETS